MEVIIFIVLALVVGIAIGFFVDRTLFKKDLQKYDLEARDKSKLILKEAELQAETMKKDRILEAKEKYLRLKFQTC